MLGYEKRRSLKRMGPILDKINIGLGVMILICAIILLIDMKKFMVMFPVMFTFAALMNLTLAIKSYKMADMLRVIFLGIAFVGLSVLSIVAYMVVL